MAKHIKDLKDLSVLRVRAGYRHSGPKEPEENKKRFFRIANAGEGQALALRAGREQSRRGRQQSRPGGLSYGENGIVSRYVQASRGTGPRPTVKGRRFFHGLWTALWDLTILLQPSQRRAVKAASASSGSAVRAPLRLPVRCFAPRAACHSPNCQRIR